jgi:DNA-binding NarL/FixJ family response regulator
MKHGIALLADSHSPMLEGVRCLLEKKFESVVMVADENSLMQAAEKLQPNLAVVDVSFPLTTRGHVVATLKERFPQITVVALSVHDEPVAVERMMSSGAAAFVLKRTATTDLLPALEEVLAGRTYVSPAAQSHLQGPHKENPEVAAERQTGRPVTGGTVPENDRLGEP